MSETIYAWFLRLFPSLFRKKYEGEALQLLRDRIRDEPGFLNRARLWVDLVTDIAHGLPLAYRNNYAANTIAAVPFNTERIPSFRVLEPEPLRRGSFLFASMLSLALLALFCFVMSRPVASRILAASDGMPSPVESVLRRLNQPASTGSAGNGETAGESASAAPGAQQASPSNASGATMLTPAPGLNADERHRVIQAIVTNLNEHYFDTDKAHAASEALLRQEAEGKYNGIHDDQAFAERLTADVRNVAQDQHLAIAFSKDTIPAEQVSPSPTELEDYRVAMMRQNCTFASVAVLPHNIGYLKLYSFPDPSICRARAETSLARLNHAGAIIFDLRENRGGYPDMVELMSSWLFDHPVPWYNPRQTSNGMAMTHSPVPGSMLADKPVYILTSSQTLSGAEHFTYNLKMLKRATVVGETTGGSAHAGAFHRIDDHFGMGIPESRITNPYGQPDWEGRGVEPDVKVTAAQALETAVKLAEVRLQKK